jgi:hypothetical protein
VSQSSLILATSSLSTASYKMPIPRSQVGDLGTYPSHRDLVSVSMRPYHHRMAGLTREIGIVGLEVVAQVFPRSIHEP